MYGYIAFLRGINVGGHQVKMERLRQLFAQLGFTNVRSYINSGNLFFDSEEEDRRSLSQMIEAELLATLGYEVPTFLRTNGELGAILDQDPFRSIEMADHKRFCVIFTDSSLDQNLTFPIHSTKNDMDLIGVNQYEAFVTWYILDGRPPSGKFPDGVIPVRNTLRFFHTLSKILRAARQSPE